MGKTERAGKKRLAGKRRGRLEKVLVAMAFTFVGVALYPQCLGQPQFIHFQLPCGTVITNQ